MSGIVRSIFNLTSRGGFVNSVERVVKPGTIKSRVFSSFQSTSCNTVKRVSLFNNYQCVNTCQYSTKKSETEVHLAKFLEEEIAAEQELHGSQTIPSKIDDFEVKLNGSDVLLVKQCSHETIKVTFSINESIERLASESEENVPELISRPTFDVNIEHRDATVVGFTCSVADHFQDNDTETADDDADVFTINELTIYKGEWKDNHYFVTGEVLDDNLLNLLMDLLDEKGITNEFVLKMWDLSTAYEHSSYISLLSELKKFVSHN